MDLTRGERLLCLTNVYRLTVKVPLRYRKTTRNPNVVS